MYGCKTRLTVNYLITATSCKLSLNNLLMLRIYDRFRFNSSRSQTSIGNNLISYSFQILWSLKRLNINDFFIIHRLRSFRLPWRLTTTPWRLALAFHHGAKKAKHGAVVRMNWKEQNIYSPATDSKAGLAQAVLDWPQFVQPVPVLWHSDLSQPLSTWLSRPLLLWLLGEYWFRISLYVSVRNRPLAHILRQNWCSLM